LSVLGFESKKEGENVFVGTIKLSDNMMLFRLDDYKLTISNTEGQYIDWDDIKAIINDRWIKLEDFSKNGIYAYIEAVEYLNGYEYKCDLQFYVVDWYRKDKKNTLEYDHIWIKSDCLDYYFRDDIKYKSDILNLINCCNCKEINDEGVEQNTVEIDAFNQKLLIEFKTMIQGSDKPFPYDVRNVMIFGVSKTSDQELLYNVIRMAKTFLKFISVNSKVDIINPVMIGSGDDINNYTAMLYIKPDNVEHINPNRCLKYDDTKSGLAKLLTMICQNEICFRSLFPCNMNKITYADIMNICAAFELQFDVSVIHNYKYKEQEKVKKKIIKIIEDSRETQFSDAEKIYCNEIIAGIKNVKETLKKRIDIVLQEFIRIYGELNIKCDFEEDYVNMPERIKNSRNALDHGNVEYKFERIMYWDAELLRAMVYMLILKTAGISDEKIFNSIKKLSKYPV
jgi:hypothetical protein